MDKEQEKDKKMEEQPVQEKQVEEQQEQNPQEKQQNEPQQEKEQKAEDELAKEKEKFLRLFAEFENYKKRTTKEKIELFKTAGEEVIKSLLPVLDDFGRALEEMKKSGDSQMLKGVELIHSKFFSTLKSNGLEEVEVAVGDEFNSDIHEAIAQVQSPDESMKGKVIDVVSKGYKIADKIIRFPKVAVGQ